MTMEIETDVVEPNVFVHPLALVHMSDQYTRIRLGGSPLDPSSPVVGVLFGTHKEDKDSSCYFVEDAGDIPLEEAGTQIELHRAVFPTHQVMGWYKVVDSDSNGNEPTAQDLKQTLQIQSLYQNAKSAPTSWASSITFFGLLQVPTSKKEQGQDEKMKSPTTSSQHGKDEEELPLTLYRLEGSALVAISTWSLRTADSERVAVQRVMKEKETGHAVSGPGEQEHQLLMTTEQKVIIPYTDEVQESCLAISSRLSLILQYLQSLPQDDSLLSLSSSSPEHLPLLRQVQGLLLQLGPIAATVPTAGDDASSKQAVLLQQLASLTKAVDSVAVYAEKVRFLRENTTSARGGPSSRDMRRF